MHTQVGYAVEQLLSLAVRHHIDVEKAPWELSNAAQMLMYTQGYLQWNYQCYPYQTEPYA